MNIPSYIPGAAWQPQKANPKAHQHVETAGPWPPRQQRNARVVILGSTQVDCVCHLPSMAKRERGAKTEVATEFRLGGSGGNMAKALGALGVSGATVISAQHPVFEAWVARELEACGGRAITACQENWSRGFTIALNRGKGECQLLVQRLGLTPAVLSPQAREALRCADLLIVGPLGHPTTPALELLREAAGELRQPGAALALTLHPTWMVERHLREVGALRPQYVQVNAEEALRVLPGEGWITAARWACMPPARREAHRQNRLMAAGERILELIGDGPEVCITNGGGTGLLHVAGQGWQDVPAAPVRRMKHDVGAGDSFAAVYAMERFVESASAEQAADHARHLAALWMEDALEAIRPRLRRAILPLEPGVTREAWPEPTELAA